MFITQNMGLTAWDLGSDPYDHTQLAQNISQIDQHNHTSGKGVQIPTEGIQNSSIVASKIANNAIIPTIHIPVDSIPASRLAPDSVGNSELQDNSVNTANIIDGAISSNKLDPSIMPIGMTIMWYRADSSILPPSGWEVMDGRSWSTIPNKLGAGGTQWNTGNIPNMVNKFPLGAGLIGTGTTPNLAPEIGAINGQHERDLTHIHTTQPHSHVVDSHTHGIGADGGHKHRFVANTPGGTVFADLFTRDVGVPKADGVRQALYLQGHNQSSFLGSDIQTPMEIVPSHSHGGATGASTSGTSASTTTVNNGLTGNQDLRPAHIGLLFIMKVQ